MIRALIHKNGNRILNVGLRLFSLGSKLLLTLYMGRYFDLTSLGIYGLVFSSVVVMTALLGQELSYIVKRSIVGLPKEEALTKIRDQIVWYGANYIIVTGFAIPFALDGGTDIPLLYIFFALFLGITENLGAAFVGNLNLLGHQIAATFSLFVRAAAWVPLAIGLGFIDPALRTHTTVLTCWAIGSLLSLGVPLWVWRNWGWRRVLATPVAWPWIFRGVRKSVFLWLGALGFMGGSYVNRYFVEHFLGLEAVGVMTFYYSFINAIFPLAETGALTFTVPKMVQAHKNGDARVFWRETFKGARQVGLGILALVLILSLFVPWLGSLLGKQEFVENINTFYFLLAAGWIQSLSLVTAYVLFAKERDRPIWMGNLFFMLLGVVNNAVLIPMLGFAGIGQSALIGALSILAWNLIAVSYGVKRSAS